MLAHACKRQTRTRSHIIEPRQVDARYPGRVSLQAEWPSVSFRIKSIGLTDVLGGRDFIVDTSGPRRLSALAVVSVSVCAKPGPPVVPSHVAETAKHITHISCTDVYEHKTIAVHTLDAPSSLSARALAARAHKYISTGWN